MEVKFGKNSNKCSMVLIFTLILSCFWACSSDKDDKTNERQSETQSSELKKIVPEKTFIDADISQEGYEGWKQYRDDFVWVFCAPLQEIMDRVPAITEKIKLVMMENATRLGVQVPSPIQFFLYNNTSEIAERTDCEGTCVLGNTFHYMIMTPLGEPIMVRLLREFDPNGTPCTFCYEGIVTYLNYSGENYVEMAYIDFYNNDIPSLEEMVDAPKYMSYDSTTRIVASASLMEYLINRSGSPQPFLNLYLRESDTRKALTDIYKDSIDQLEKGWYEYLKKHSGLEDLGF